MHGQNSSKTAARQPDRTERRRTEALGRRRYGWKVNQWSDAVGCSRSSTYELIAAKRIDSVKLGGARIIITHPEHFLASLATKDA